MFEDKFFERIGIAIMIHEDNSDIILISRQREIKTFYDEIKFELRMQKASHGGFSGGEVFIPFIISKNH